MRIVTDGEKFAIQKGWIFKKYLYIGYREYFWTSDPLNDCWYSKEIVERAYNAILRRKNWRKV